MKYVAIIDSDEFSEDALKDLTTELRFLSEHSIVYNFKITSIKEAPDPLSDYEVGYFVDGYNQALEDCGVIEGEN
jgi:hypothetical protein